MTTALVIDTSSAYCSLALQSDGQVFACHELLGRKHNERVLAMLDELFAQAGTHPAQVDVIGYNAGPGSFTGVRIAAAVAQAIAFAGTASVVSIRSSRAVLNTLLQSEPDLMGSCPGVVVIWPSRADLYYLSAFGLDSEHVGVVQTEQLLQAPPEWLADYLAQQWRIAGPIPEWMETPPEHLGELAPSAQAQLGYVLERYHAGEAAAPELALPVYLAEDSPWVAVSQRSP